MPLITAPPPRCRRERAISPGLRAFSLALRAAVLLPGTASGAEFSCQPRQAWKALPACGLLGLLTVAYLAARVPLGLGTRRGPFLGQDAAISGPGPSQCSSHDLVRRGYVTLATTVDATSPHQKRSRDPSLCRPNCLHIGSAPSGPAQSAIRPPLRLASRQRHDLRCVQGASDWVARHDSEPTSRPADKTPCSRQLATRATRLVL